MIKLIFKYEYLIKDKIQSDYYLVELFYCNDSNWYYRIEGSGKLNITPINNKECPNINDPIEFIEKKNNFTYVGKEIDHNKIIELYYEDQILKYEEQQEIEDQERPFRISSKPEKENFISKFLKINKKC